MAISHTLLKIKHRSGCILCGNKIDRATIGNLCNSCKDGFAANFSGFSQMEMNRTFAM